MSAPKVYGLGQPFAPERLGIPETLNQRGMTFEKSEASAPFASVWPFGGSACAGISHGHCPKLSLLYLGGSYGKMMSQVMWDIRCSCRPDLSDLVCLAWKARRLST